MLPRPTSVRMPSRVLGQSLVPTILSQVRYCLCNGFQTLRQFSGYPTLIHHYGIEQT
jgi:hypothetical protein